jgi:hypothetical protein
MKSEKSLKDEETKDDLGKDGIFTSSRKRLHNLHFEVKKNNEEKEGGRVTEVQKRYTCHVFVY